MNRIKLGTLLLVLALPAAAFGNGHDPASIPSGAGVYGTFAVTHSLKGKIAEINAEERLIAIEDKNGKRHAFMVGDNAAFKAGKKTELAGKQNLSLSDFQPGQPVKITYRAADNTVTVLRLRRAKK